MKVETLPRETRMRSFLKGISWRILATLTTVVIAYTITNDTAAAIQIGGVEVIAKLLFYYMHERLWQLLPRGTIRHIETEVFSKHGTELPAEESSDPSIKP